MFPTLAVVACVVGMLVFAFVLQRLTKKRKSVRDEPGVMETEYQEMLPRPRPPGPRSFGAFSAEERQFLMRIPRNRSEHTSVMSQ